MILIIKHNWLIDQHKLSQTERMKTNKIRRLDSYWNLIIYLIGDTYYYDLIESAQSLLSIREASGRTERSIT